MWLKIRLTSTAAGQGFEPRLLGPEPSVLPLDDPAALPANHEFRKHTDNEQTRQTDSAAPTILISNR